MQTTTSLKGKRVLVVDDSRSQMTGVIALYKELGCEVVGQAENGIEALKKIKELHPEIVSLDIIMPDMDGIECYQNISKNYPEIKVIFLSCLVKNLEVREVLTKKIDPAILLPKPCEKEVLLKALTNLWIN